MKNLDKHLKEYTQKKSLKPATVKALIEILYYRLNGYTLESIAEHLDLSKTRIATLERNFLHELAGNIRDKYMNEMKEAKRNKNMIK